MFVWEEIQVRKKAWEKEKNSLILKPKSPNNLLFVVSSKSSKIKEIKPWRVERERDYQELYIIKTHDIHIMYQ